MVKLALFGRSDAAVVESVCVTENAEYVGVWTERFTPIPDNFRCSIRLKISS